MEILSFHSLSERGPLLGSGEGPESPHFIDGKFLPPPRFWFRKGSTQGSYFEAIIGVFPYPNESCNKIGFLLYCRSPSAE